VSRYLNETAPSEQRATVLSFRGLSTNFAYGLVAIAYSKLIAIIKSREVMQSIEDPDVMQETVFIESLSWFPGYFLATVVLVLVVHRLRFSRSTSILSS
ncbi:MAG: hypothetical protein ACPGSB_02315, partial [Opitutales bacterium]